MAALSPPQTPRVITNDGRTKAGNRHLPLSLSAAVRWLLGSADRVIGMGARVTTPLGLDEALRLLELELRLEELVVHALDSGRNVYQNMGSVRVGTR